MFNPELDHIGPEQHAEEIVAAEGRCSWEKECLKAAITTATLGAMPG